MHTTPDYLWHAHCITAAPLVSASHHLVKRSSLEIPRTRIVRALTDRLWQLAWDVDSVRPRAKLGNHCEPITNTRAIVRTKYLLQVGTRWMQISVGSLRCHLSRNITVEWKDWKKHLLA